MKRIFCMLWASLNYKYCMVEQYLALNRGDTMEAVHWGDQAYYWKRSYQERHIL